MPRFSSSFLSLNITQFLAALNDNLYKLLLAFFLINLYGDKYSNIILALAGVIFVFPFLLFASIAGTLADRYSKRFLILFTRITEILTTCLGVLAFSLASPIGGYIVLFLMAVQSAIFSPCKYGIIPEIVPLPKISHYNGIITATTYLAIILGTFLASFLTEANHKNFVLSGCVCMGVAVVSCIAAIGIQKTSPQAAKEKVSTRFVSDLLHTFQQAKKTRYLLPVLLCSAYFLFIGSYTQLNVIPYTLQSLHLSEVDGGYLFLITSIGVGLGAYLAGRLSSKEIELGFVPLAAWGMVVCFFGLYLFSSYFLIVVFLLILAGLCGGFYIVPIDAFIQVVSPDRDRGKNVAAGNFLSFIGVFCASGLLALLGSFFHLTAAQGFRVMGVIGSLIAAGLSLFYAGQVMRLGASLWARKYFALKGAAKKSLVPSKSHTLYVAPYVTKGDLSMAMAVLPRLVHYIIPTHLPTALLRPFYRPVSLTPLPHKQLSPLQPQAVETLQQILKQGSSACLLYPLSSTPTQEEWESQMQSLASLLPTPYTAIYFSTEKDKKKRHTLSTKQPLRVIYREYGAIQQN